MNLDELRELIDQLEELEILRHAVRDAEDDAKSAKRYANNASEYVNQVRNIATRALNHYVGMTADGNDIGEVARNAIRAIYAVKMP